MKSAVLCCSVSDFGELSGIINLPLDKNALFKNVFTIEPWHSLCKDINGRRILSKL